MLDGQKHVGSFNTDAVAVYNDETVSTLVHYMLTPNVPYKTKTVAVLLRILARPHYFAPSLDAERILALLDVVDHEYLLIRRHEDDILLSAEFQV